ncbi:hypothetical protein [Ardenticatena maritima]|uniref:hypothetical protein n=1 Tax=Ardenticatena maritima TaxID=872965 RepID=UPI00128F6AB5|nr:hypothetical protein [Ardenticatena maritima]
MALANSWTQRHPRTHDLIELPWYGHLVGAFIFAIPFLWLAVWVHSLGFISDTHAVFTAKVLLALDRGRLEFVGFTYPPLPFLLTMLAPSPLTPSIWSALAAGATAWLLWQHLWQTRFSTGILVLLLVAMAITSSSAYVATQSLDEMSTLFFFLLAWRFFLGFTHRRETWGGFAAGLVLGLAFFFHAYAVLFGVLYALATPFFRVLPPDIPPRKRWQALLTSSVIVAFPSLLAFGTWTYINWLFTGDALRFLAEPASPVYAFLHPAATPVYGLVAAVRTVVSDLLHLPLVIAIGVIVAYHTPDRLFAFLIAPLIILLVRAMGLAYPPTFAAGTLSVMALAALPRRASPRWRMLLVPAALLHIAIGLFAPPAQSITREWGLFLLQGTPREADLREQAIAERLRLAPPGSILADDHTAYRLIARAGTARPFLLPVDGDFTAAVQAPRRFVRYVLVAEQPVPGEALAPRYATQAPPGFVLEAAWPGWRLYRRLDTPPLLTE